MVFDWSGSRDVNGYRVSTGGFRDGAQVTGNGNGFAGNFWEATWGLNYLVGNNLVIRPEVRYDWYSRNQVHKQVVLQGNMPYGPNLNRTVSSMVVATSSGTSKNRA